MLSIILDQIKPSFLTNLEFNTDDDAIEIIYWLKLRLNRANTYKTYRVVVFRFYLWLKFKNYTLKTITRKEIIDYLEFIQSPPPEWCGTRHHFNHREWKPFHQKLSQTGMQFNIQIIRQLFNDLAQTSYIVKSPVPHNLKYSIIVTNLPIEKYLTKSEFKQLYKYIESLPEINAVGKNRKIRIKWIINLLIYTGARRAELSNARMSDIFFKNDKCWLKVIGKGNKYGEIPVIDALEKSLDEYRRFYGLPKIRSRIDLEVDIPLIIRSRPDDKQIKSHNSTICREVKIICAQFAKTVTDQSFVKKLMKVSTHWFRHTSATLQVDAGIDIRVVQRNLRHSSIETTMLYQHVQQDSQHDEINSKFNI